MKLYRTFHYKATQCLLLLLALTLCLSAMRPVSARGEAQTDDPIAYAVQYGQQLVDNLPRLGASDVIGYDYYKTLPDYWEAVQRSFDFLQFRFTDALLNVNREQYYFAAALTLCATDEPAYWLDAQAFDDFRGADGDIITSGDISQLMATIADKVSPEYTSAMEDWAAGLKVLNITFSGISEFCKAANQKALLDCIDWAQAEQLAETWIKHGNGTMAQTGKMLLSLKEATDTDRSLKTAMDVLENFGLDTIVSEIASLTVENAAGAVGYVYQATLFGVDAFTRFSVLTGSFNDMTYAAEILAACYEDQQKAARNFFFTPGDEYYFGDEASLRRLESDFSRVMYTGINYLYACAVMNDAYASYIDIGKNSLAGKLYINDTMIERAEQAKEDAQTFRLQAELLQDQLALLRRLIKEATGREDTPSTPRDAADIWAHHWVKADNPGVTLDITRNADGTLHLRAHFDQLLDFDCDMDVYDLEYSEYSDPSGQLAGSMVVMLEHPDKLYLSAVEGSILEDESDFAYLYFTYENFEFILRDVVAEPVGEQLTEAERQALFSDLAAIGMRASSGVGAWEGYLKIDASGAFKGFYYDDDMMERYEVSFSGTFGGVYRLSDTTYLVEVASVATLQEPGTDAWSDWGAHLNYIDALFTAGENLLLTVPGTPPGDIPETVKSLIGGSYLEWDDPSKYYTLTLLDDGWGFFTDEWYPWSYDVMQPAATATPVPTPEPTAAPTAEPVAQQPVGPTHYDDGVFAFDAPGEATVVAAVQGTSGTQGVTIYMPRPADYNAKVLERVSWSSTVDDMPTSDLIIMMIRVAPVQSSYWKSYELDSFDAESLSRHIAEHYVEYLGSKPTEYGSMTVAGKNAWYIQRDPSDAAIMPDANVDYYIQLSADTVGWISTQDGDDAGIRDVLEQILSTLEIRVAGDSQPEPAVTDAPAPEEQSAELPVEQPEPTEDTFAGSLLPISGKPGYLQVPVSRVDATSFIEGKDPTAYAPFRMIDGDETTAYQFSTKTTRLGQAYLYFDFDEPVTLDELWMKNGFWTITDGYDQYTRNSRVKKMTIYIRYGSGDYQQLKTVSLKDDKAREDWKVITLMGQEGVTGVRIRIDEIYQGSKYKNDVCISEIMFVQVSE